VFSATIGTLGWFVVASVAAVAGDACVCLGVVVAVSTYSTDLVPGASAVMVSKSLAFSALVCGAGGEVFFGFALPAENGGTISDESLHVWFVLHSYDTGRVSFIFTAFWAC
jgi:hypothetical protein